MRSGSLSWIDSAALDLDWEQQNRFVASLSDAELEYLAWSWRHHARPEQLLPGTAGAAVDRADWTIWLLLAGRGFGKTKTGAETVREWAEEPNARIMLVGPTTADVRDVMIEGPSGLLAAYPPHQEPSWEPSKHLIQFPSGAVGITRSAEEPERLRGPQFTKFWFDELAASQYAQEAWDQVQFGFRLPGASRIQGLVTTTPKPIKVLKALISHPDTVITRGSSDDNRANLDPVFIQRVLDPYRGTRLGRQEIDAEILDDVQGALWKRKVIDDLRITRDSVQQNWNRIVRIVIAVDPAVSHKEDSDETGIIAAGLTQSRHGLVLSDRSGQYTTQEWADQAIDAFLFYRADCIVAEKNQGGDLVEAAIRTAAEKRGLNPLAIPYKGIWAKRGKHLRAEPVSMLYEQGRIHHAGTFPALEDQMTNWTPMSGDDSPDRLDALVYAISELLVDNTVIQLAAQFMQPVEIF